MRCVRRPAFLSFDLFISVRRCHQASSQWGGVEPFRHSGAKWSREWCVVVTPSFVTMIKQHYSACRQ